MSAMRGRAGRARLAALLATFALIAALIGAFGPADALRTTYSWPPDNVPDATPRSVWYAPLLLIRHRPEEVTADIPCTLPPPLPAAGNPVTVLATARNPGRNGGLDVTRAGPMLVVRVNGHVLTRVGVATDSSTTGACRHRLSFGDGRWSVSSGAESSAEGGDLETMPVVSGLFSEVDLTHPNRPSMAITTAVHGSRTTARQAAFSILAVLASVASLWLVVGGRMRRPWARLRSGKRGAFDHAHPADAVVALSLVGWWVLSPAFWDDGWVVATQSAFATSHGFSNYYEVLGTNLPSGYWLEWVQHWIVQSNDALLVLRVPALLLLGATWILCRWILLRTTARDEAIGRTALWAMTTAFIGGAMAWGMTLRPEPVTATLATAALACAVAFPRRPSGGLLALIAVLVPLAITAHHTGVVAIAPVVAIIPNVWRWGRGRRPDVVALVGSGAALAVVLAFLGADIAQRLADVAATREHGIAVRTPWYDEFARYERLIQSGWGTPLRFGSVSLMAVTILAFLLLRKRVRNVDDLPAKALIFGLPLLVVTPSKLPWHFGALIGIAAVAAGVEAGRLRRAALGATRLRARAVLVPAAVFALAGGAWAVRNPWNPIDLRTLDWRAGFEAAVPLEMLVPLLPVVGVVALALVERSRRAPHALSSAPWRVASWSAPILMTPLIAFTVVVLVADSARTHSWTLARQNVDTLAGKLQCGLGDELLVDLPGSDRDDAPVAELMRASPVLVFPSALMYFPCARLPRLADGVVEVPGYIVPPERSETPVRYASSPFYGVLDLYEIKRRRWASENPPTEIELFEVRERIPGALEIPPTKSPLIS